MTYRHHVPLLIALTSVLSGACGGGSGRDGAAGGGNGDAGRAGATASGGASAGSTGETVSGGAGGASSAGSAGSAGGTQTQTPAAGASSGDPDPIRSLITPDLVEGFWKPVRSRTDQCKAPAVEDESPQVDDLRFQNNVEQGYLEAFRCSGTQSCRQASGIEYRFPIEQDGTVGENIVVSGGRAPVVGEPCLAYRTRYFLILSDDRQTLEYVWVGESGPGVIQNEMCRYDNASDGSGFECLRREWVEFIRVTE